MDKLHCYICQMDDLLAKYVKIAKVDSAHILKLDKTMENRRFMTDLDNQYMNESDNKKDKEDNVEDVDPGNKLVNSFNNGLNEDNDDDDDKDVKDRNSGNDDNEHVNANERMRQYVASSFSGNYRCGQVLQRSNCFVLQVTIPLNVHRTNFISS
jgi:hypothetical protein